MKRHKRKTPCKFGVVIVFPIFSWVQCCSCRYEFKLKKMWRKSMRLTKYSAFPVTKYCCINCAPDIKQASIMFRKHMSRSYNIPH